MLILIVEDDVDYADIMAELLQREGYEVVVAGSLDGARRIARQVESLDGALLDVMLRDGSGFDLAQELRAQHRGLPIVFLTSLSSSAAVVNGFKAGADDYIVKPFHPAELLARMQAVLRRASVGRGSPEQGSEPVVTLTARPSRGLHLDEENATAYFNGVKLACTPLEFQILFELARVPGQVLSHAYLNDRVWQYRNLSDGTLLKGHISSLRRKLKEAGGDPWMIRTVHGVGYSYSAD